jgi:hypothetical protein
MKQISNQKGTIHLVVLALLIAGLVIGVVVVGKTTNILPFAKEKNKEVMQEQKMDRMEQKEQAQLEPEINNAEDLEEENREIENMDIEKELNAELNLLEQELSN